MVNINKKSVVVIAVILFVFQSVGCTIDGRTPREVTDAVTNGELEVPEE